MIDVGVDVAEKAVFLRRGFVPRGARFFFGEADLHDAFAAFEAVFPRRHQAQRRAVLIGQHLAIHAKGQHRERVHGFIEAQGFDIREIKRAIAQTIHLLGVGQGDEFHVFRVAHGLDFFDEFSQRVAHPRDHHAPAFDAAHAVNALFHGREFEQIFNAYLAGLFDEAADLNRPRLGLQGVCVAGGIGFVCAEFVEIVVRRCVFVIGELFHHIRAADCAFAAGQFGKATHGARIACRKRGQCCTCRARTPQFQQITAAFKRSARRDLAGDAVIEAIGIRVDQHENTPYVAIESKQ